MTWSLTRALFVLACCGVAACTAPAVRQEPPAPPRPDVPALFAQALAAQDAGEHERAIDLWKTVIAAAPDQAAPHTNLGILYRASGRLDDAIREYQLALGLDARDAIAHHNLAVAYRAQGAWTDAERAYLRALELSPNQVETHYNLGILYELFLNRPEDALTQYRAALSLGGPDAEAVAQWIRSLERRLARNGMGSPGAP